MAGTAGTVDGLGWEWEHCVSQTSGPEIIATVEVVFAAEVVCDEIGPEPLGPAGAPSHEPNETKRTAAGGAVGAVGAWL